MIVMTILMVCMEIGSDHWNGHVQIVFACGIYVTYFLGLIHQNDS